METRRDTTPIGTFACRRLKSSTNLSTVNLQAQGELKQQGTVVCPPGYRPRVASADDCAAIASRSDATPPSTPVIVPRRTRFRWHRPSRHHRRRSTRSLCSSVAIPRASSCWTGSIATDNWRSFARHASSRSTRPATALYRTRFAEIVPADQFPVVLFQDSSGGHVHAAGRSMIPTTPDELYSDLRQGYELYQQTRQAQKTGALKTRGYSWDEAISPTMYLSLEDCPDGYCPVEPTDTWRPGDRVRDLLFDEVRRQPKRILVGIGRRTGNACTDRASP